MTDIKLRPWQQSALNKAINWLVNEKKDKRFLINAAPGAGKTVAACMIAKHLIEAEEIERVVVIAPRVEVVSQWATDFKRVTGRYMSKVTASDGDIEGLGIDVCVTWAAVQGLNQAFKEICSSNNTLVICDEHHHAAVEATWGGNADSAFSTAKFALILTGTPIRSDGEQTVWMAYDSEGAIDHPEDGTYTLTYGEAVELGYCRPATFHRHEGKFRVDLEGGSEVRVSGSSELDLDTSLKRIPGLQAALSFYKLACKPQFAKDAKTPSLDSYQASMLEWGSAKLDELRERLPEAGRLVIAPNIEVAEYMAQILEMIEGEAPVIVHSKLSNPNSKISAYRNTNKRWLVSVAMISEGVDIPRLRVLVYLPNALTELAFRQAVGRVVRTQAYDDDTRAYVVMPAFSTFDAYARRVEREMPASALNSSKGSSNNKKCPICLSECPKGAERCDACGHEFQRAPTAGEKTCHSCGAANARTAQKCDFCEASFEHDFKLSLDEALRDGVIVKGMDIGEEEAREGEAMAASVRSRALSTGDESIIKLFRSLPEESFARVRQILDG